jgi:protein-L-isoaspartate(D-aspartate) O-methyltransferase
MAPTGDGARRRNRELVAQLESSGSLHDPVVAAAFRAVLRHHFLPGLPLKDVYEDSAITTKVGPNGEAVSSSSQPAIMALMLEQLQVAPDSRVLEIGTGTGYNAALLAQVASGQGGRVTTLDIDEELCAQARANLRAAGAEHVEVRCADGAEGWPEGAPYDRLIVTACGGDLAPAWLDQLTEGGRLVCPLALAGPVQESIAFVRRGRALYSDNVAACGFVPLQGPLAPPPATLDDQLRAWLEEPGRPTGATVPAADLRAGFESWLALTENGYVRLWPRGAESAAFGLRDERGVALAVAADRDHVVARYGDGEDAERRLITAHRSWTATRPQMDQLVFAAYPAGEEPLLDSGVRILRRERFTFVVTPAGR